MKAITEEDKDIIEGWFKRAAELRETEELAAFIAGLNLDYTHDYGTICHAVTAAAVGAANVMNRQSQGGITGFQAGCIFWEFRKRWMHESGPAKLLSYDKMLYPQYEADFRRTITKSTWEWLQKKAAEKLQENVAAEECIQHWKRILAGVVPFGFEVVDD